MSANSDDDSEYQNEQRGNPQPGPSRQMGDHQLTGTNSGGDANAAKMLQLANRLAAGTVPSKHQHYLNRLSDEERERRKQIDRERSKRNYQKKKDAAASNADQSQAPSSREVSLERKRMRTQEERSSLTPAEAAAIQEQNTAQHSLQRSQRSEAQTVADRQTNSTQRATLRSQLTQDQVEAQRQSNTTQRAVRRSQLPEEQIAEERAANAAQMAGVRRRRDPLFEAAILTESGYLRSPDLPRHNLGGRDQTCDNCGAVHFAHETNSRKLCVSTGERGKVYSSCCDNGQIDPAIFRRSEYPPELARLFTITRATTAAEKQANVQTNKFMTSIIKYNQTLAMASMGYKKASLPGSGPFVFKVAGMVYHTMYNIAELGPGELAHHNQLWLLSTGEAQAARRRLHPTLDSDILTLLKDQLMVHNPLFRQYRTIYDWAEGQQLRDYSIKFFVNRGDGLNFELPATSNEIVAAVSDADLDNQRGVFVYKRNDAHPHRCSFIDYKSELVDALTYPLLYPKARKGWSIGLKKNSRPNAGNLTLMHYYGHEFSERPGQFNPVLHARNLTQQFAVDSACKVISNRLEYISTHQQELRSDTFQEVSDFLGDLAEVDYPLSQQMARDLGNARDNADAAAGGVAVNRPDDGNIGAYKKLPASFRGGPRHNKKNYYNALSLVSACGKPDYLVTITCNPDWPEITSQLAPGEKACDRPDIVTRVFDGKAKALISYIEKKGIFGTCEAVNGVTEFQKRGLPHAHILIWVKREFKPNTPEMVNRVVCAEIPDEATQPELYQAVTKFMVHRKCGPETPEMPCWRRKKLGKRNRARVVVAGVPVEQAQVQDEDQAVQDMLNETDELYEIEEDVIAANNVFDYDDMLAFDPEDDAPDDDIAQDDVQHMEVDVAAEAGEQEIEHLSQGVQRISTQERAQNQQQQPAREKCGMGFPKEFQTTTFISGNYPRYRRRNDGRTLMKKNTVTNMFEEYDNQWVVPYNPFLLLHFDTHINVEVVSSSTQACKYLFAYLHKGDDMANISFLDAENRDEVKAYASTKCITSMEAMYFISSLKTYFISHSIIRLDVHLPNHQLIYWRNGQLQSAAQQSSGVWTTLTGWFELNKMCASLYDDPERVALGNFIHLHHYTNARGEDKTVCIDLGVDSRQYHYHEIPRHFTFHTAQQGMHYWSRRKKGGEKVLGRLFHVNPISKDPKEQERYYLRLLLLHVKGVTSFAGLLTDTAGQPVESLKEACLRRGLLESDSGHEQCLDEAVIVYRPYHLRHLFVMILATNAVTDPSGLFNKFKGKMYEDFVHREGIDEDEAEKKLYLTLERIGLDFSIELNNYLPRPEDYPANIGELEAEMDLRDLQQEGETRYTILRGLQKDACDFILKQIDKPASDPTKSNLIAIDGPGGSGKTTLYKAVYSLASGSQRKLKVLCVAYSGVAAFLLPNGRTAHSAFRLKFDMNAEDFTSTLRVQSPYAEELREVAIIIWDEISMVPRWALSAVDLLFQDLMKNTLPFGGKMIIVGGDFRQVLPVVKNGDRVSIYDACVKKHELWPQFHQLSLVENLRCRDVEYQEFLLGIGNGTLGTATMGQEALGMRSIELPEDLMVENLPMLIDFVYNSVTFGNNQLLGSSAILAARNYDVNRINDIVLGRLTRSKGRDNPEACYLSHDELAPDSDLSDCFCVELLNNENPPGFPPHRLELEVGAVVSLVRNLSVRQGLTNGTRMIIERFNRYTIECRVITSTGDRIDGRPNTVVIPRIPLKIDAESNGIGATFIRRQFPLRLSFAMTINKSQGQTLDRVGLYLEHPVFSHGQLYVGLSRVRERNNIRICSGSTTTPNIVWREALINRPN